MKKTGNKGITIIALIITIVVTLILITIGIEYGQEQLEKSKIEDLKTTMLLIKGKAQIVVDKEYFGETYTDDGMLAYADAATYTANIPSALQEDLTSTENLYIWEQTAMDNNNIETTITSQKFFIINYETMEIYYSEGISLDGNTYYSLSQLQGL